MKFIITLILLFTIIIVNSADIEINGKIYKNYELEKISEDYVNIVYDGGAKKILILSLPEEIIKQLKEFDAKIDLANFDIEKEKKAYKQNCIEIKKLYRQLKNSDLLEFQIEGIRNKIKDIEQKSDGSYKIIEKYEKKQAEKEMNEKYNSHLYPKKLSQEERLQRQKILKDCL